MPEENFYLPFCQYQLLNPSVDQNISEGVSAAARDTQSVTTAVSNLSQSVQRTDESVNAVNSAANSLSERAEALRADTQEFLRKMRAA